MESNESQLRKRNVASKTPLQTDKPVGDDNPSTATQLDVGAQSQPATTESTETSKLITKRKGWISCSNFIWLCIVVYLVFLGWTIHQLSDVPHCSVTNGEKAIARRGDGDCYFPMIDVQDKIDIVVLASHFGNIRQSGPSDTELVAWEVGLNPHDEIRIRGKAHVPHIVRLSKGTLYGHVIILKHEDGTGSQDDKTELSLTDNSKLHQLLKKAIGHVIVPLTTKSQSGSSSIKKRRPLMGNSDSTLDTSTHLVEVTDQPPTRSFFKYVYHPIVVRFVDVQVPLRFPVNFRSPDRSGMGTYRVDQETGRMLYSPTLYLDETALLQSHKVELSLEEGRPPVPIMIRFTPISVLRNSWVLLLSAAMDFLNQAMSEREVDEFRYLLSDDHIYRFILTQVISWLHLAFDFLAFKNDIGFYVGRKDMAGISSSSLIASFGCSLVIFLYLQDGGGTSLVVLISVGSGVVIEGWKVFKFLQPRFVLRFPFVAFRDLSSLSNSEKETAQYDLTARRYLWYVLGPLLVVWSVYALYSYEYTSWYSWAISSLANGVYAFGFIAMCPQLYINYKLKSVAHLPWRVFMYKIFNTFVDDVFAFIIEMPMKHRIMTLRDDLVFVVYLYQAYVYRVDHSRPNEFGFVYDSNQPELSDGDIKNQPELDNTSAAAANVLSHDEAHNTGGKRKTS